MSAVFSPCRKYRYALRRKWIGGSGCVTFIMLNPSIANESEPDRTMTRCMNFAKTWGFNSMAICNLFAFVATDPKDLMRAADPVGPHCDAWIKDTVLVSDMVVAAWGAKGSYRNRDEEVLKLITNWHAIKLTKEGHPQHPLYLPGDLKPFSWYPL